MNNEPLVIFHHDGRITLGANAKPDEAAREFLRILSEMYPQWISDCAKKMVTKSFEEAMKP